MIPEDDAVRKKGEAKPASHSDQGLEPDPDLADQFGLIIKGLIDLSKDDTEDGVND
jgi:hypothetical protein